MRLNAERKREIERVLLETYDALSEIRTKTGYSVSVAAYGSKESYCCIFIHTKKGIASIGDRSEIEGFLDSEKWRNRQKNKKKK